MVQRYLRTRSRKRVKVTTPGGRRVVHFKKEKAGRVPCGRCGKQLGGVPNLNPSEIGSVSPSGRVPNRPYAGVLCGECSSSLVRYVTRFEVKYSHPDFKKLELHRDLTLERFLPAGWHAEVSKGVVKKEKVAAASESGEKAVKKKEKEKAPQKRKGKKDIKGK
jgi:large subunit ribosomal protein L34e